MTVAIINDFLLARAEQTAEDASNLQQDAKFYQDFRKNLPRFFPVPDDIIIKPKNLDFDAFFVYKIQPNEKPEALRMAISLAFSLTDWYGELQKDTSLFSVFGVFEFLGKRVLIKIIGANFSDYSFEFSHDTGSRLIGSIRCIQFVPFDVLRQDATSNIFLERNIQFDGAAYHAKQWAKILSIAGNNMPASMPVPNDIVVGLGLTFDLDLIYNEDKDGILRQTINKAIGYKGDWTLSVQKETFTQSLHAIMDVDCDPWALKIRASILKPFFRLENLTFILDTQHSLLYAISNETPDDG